MNEVTEKYGKVEQLGMLKMRRSLLVKKRMNVISIAPWHDKDRSLLLEKKRINVRMISPV